MILIKSFLFAQRALKKDYFFFSLLQWMADVDLRESLTEQSLPPAYQTWYKIQILLHILSNLRLQYLLPILESPKILLFHPNLVNSLNTILSMFHFHEQTQCQFHFTN